MKTPLSGVVFDEIGQVIRRNEIVDCHHIEFFSEEPLLAKSPENQSADSAETIDCDLFICHRRSERSEGERERQRVTGCAKKETELLPYSRCQISQRGVWGLHFEEG